MPAKKPVVKEVVIEQALRRQVEALGGLCLKVTTLGRRGFPDRLVILPGGRVAFVELKRPRGSRLTIHQRVYMKLLNTLNVEFYVVKTLTDIARLLS